MARMATLKEQIRTDLTTAIKARGRRTYDSPAASASSVNDVISGSG